MKQKSHTFGIWQKRNKISPKNIQAAQYWILTKMWDCNKYFMQLQKWIHDITNYLKANMTVKRTWWLHFLRQRSHVHFVLKNKELHLYCWL